MKKILLTIPAEVYNLLVKSANKDDRSIVGQIRSILKHYLTKNQDNV